MRKTLRVVLALMLMSALVQAAEDISGVWRTVDDETNEPKSLVQIYKHQDKYFGRVIKLFKNPDATAKDIKGSPKILGLDVIWNMAEDGKEFSGGKILDPKKGKIYSCVIWKKEDGNLNVRGKIGPFGRSQTWFPTTEPPLSGLTPQIPEKE